MHPNPKREKLCAPDDTHRNFKLEMCFVSERTAKRNACIEKKNMKETLIITVGFQRKLLCVCGRWKIFAYQNGYRRRDNSDYLQ